MVKGDISRLLVASYSFGKKRFGLVSNAYQRINWGPKVGYCTLISKASPRYVNGPVEEWISVICFWLAAMWNCDSFCIKDTHTHTQTWSQIIITFHLNFASIIATWLHKRGKKKTTKNVLLVTSFLVGTDRSTGGAIFKATLLISAWWEHSFIENMPVIWLWSLRLHAECETTHRNHIRK